MSRRNRKRKSPAPKPAPAAAPVNEDVLTDAEIRRHIEDDHEYEIVIADADPAVFGPLLRDFATALDADGAEKAREVAEEIRKSGVRISERTSDPEEPEPVEPEDDVPAAEVDDSADEEAFEDDEPVMMPFAPLAAGIQIFEAMLIEAKSGFIAARVQEIADVMEEEFTPEERAFLADYASRWKDAAGLPDVMGAYQALLAQRDEGEVP